jgi:hypothetical protein
MLALLKEKCRIFIARDLILLKEPYIKKGIIILVSISVI